MHDVVQVDFIVRRKSGGPMMLVTAISSEGPGSALMASCAWQEGSSPAQATVPLDELVSFTRI